MRGVRREGCGGTDINVTIQNILDWATIPGGNASAEKRTAPRKKKRHARRAAELKLLLQILLHPAADKHQGNLAQLGIVAGGEQPLLGIKKTLLRLPHLYSRQIS